MNKIRIGNDIPIQWTLTRGDTAINLENASTLKLMIVASLATIEISDYTISGAGNNILNFVFYGSAQRYCGSYRLIVIINQNIEGMMTIESQPIIELSAYAPQPTEPIATTGMTTDVILPSQGYSAYNIAIQNGFIGTEAEWLDSLIGESLYEMMIRTGRFVGTEEQFLLQYEDSLINVDQKASLAAEAANLANTKAELANTAAGNADTKAALAAEKAALANTAAGNADTKAALAAEKAALANTAASNADTKAALAAEKAALADTAAGNADTKAALAAEKAALANTAAGNADTKAALAAEKAALANTAAGNADTKGALAAEKAALANTAAGNADALVSRLLVAIDYDPTDGDMYVILGSNNIIDAVETSEDGDVTLVCNF